MSASERQRPLRAATRNLAVDRHKLAAPDAAQFTPDAELQSRQAEWIARRFRTTPSMARIIARLVFEDGRVEAS